MKYLPISPELFIKNRLKFSQQMEPRSIAVFNSNDVFSTGADSTLPFEQHRNIFYLSGVDQEESILIIFPSATNAAYREILFVKETNDHIAVWEGAKLSKAQATAATGELKRYIG
jgi:Xaa-Pro aminopeptidase